MSKNIIITGTSRGIGFELVKLFANGGHNVLALSRNEKPIQSLDLDNVTAFSFDLGDSNAYKNVEDFIKKEWSQVDVLINNAGMGITGPIEETPTDQMRNVFNTNLFGAIDVMKAVLPQMRKQKKAKAYMESLKKGDRVALVGFGSFSVSKRGARTGRNPQTGAEIKISAKKTSNETF